ncbi:MAG TPA: copper homeostasis protein CutC [Bacteroidales bacterium]|nr:copper homeostasis protein CutC [Bacteroidales bacterium]HNS46381.1 copper homeostasis protein CutC [Bacteroidales bacterium]
MILEITVNSVTSALLAQEGEADRIELCDNFHEGGTTPGAGSIAKARELLHVGLFVMIRPRGGDFHYSDMEVEIMQSDIQSAKELGVDGVVFGLLNPDGTVDRKRTAELVALSRPLQVTFHRAFDMTPDPFAALEDVIDAGADRILTSGQAPSALEGSAVIASLVKQAGDRISIMAGAGINESNILELCRLTQAAEFHASLRTRRKSGMLFQREGVFLGDPGISVHSFDIAAPSRIARMKRILSGHP